MDGIPDAHHHRLNHGQAEEGGDRGINSVSALANARASRLGTTRRFVQAHPCDSPLRTSPRQLRSRLGGWCRPSPWKPEPVS